MRVLDSVFQTKYWVTAFVAALFSLVCWKITQLEFRFTLALAVGLLFLSVSMIGISYIVDILVLAMVFNIPFSIFGKVLFKQDIPYAVMPGFSMGLKEVMLLMAYLIWFGQVFIVRKEPLPKLRKIDFFILLLIFSQAMSLLGAPDKLVGVFDIIHNIKHVMLYYFIAHKVKRSHLKWIIILLLFAIMLESSLALFERSTGNVGIGRTKGKSSSRIDTEIGVQKKTPGIVEQIRAEGTTIDPHVLGEYFSMILPVPFVLMMMRHWKLKIRLALAIILIIGIGGLIVTFSRSGWCSFGISSVFALGIIIFSWKQTKALFIAIVLFVIVSISYPRVYEYLIVRFVKSPSELLTLRFAMNRTALGIWHQNFFFGYGSGNYSYALEEPDVIVHNWDDRSKTTFVVHNLFLYLVSEIGLFGMIGFYGPILLAMFKCWTLRKCPDPLIRGLALAILTGLFGYLLDGLTNPLCRELVPYAQLWVYIGICMSLRQMSRDQAQSIPSETK